MESIHPEMLKALVNDVHKWLPDVDEAIVESIARNMHKRLATSLNSSNKRIENLEATLEQYRNLSENQVSAHKTIVGALKDSINTHGPIDKTWTGSATKRIIGSLVDVKLLSRDQKT